MVKNSDCRPAIILGMHDAIVSLTGLIAGLFFAFSDSNIIIISCIISSITAALSMGAANYLATKSENGEIALKSALYTGGAYMITCVFLILPFFVFSERAMTLIASIFMAILIILVFNRCCYRGRDFYRHFLEMLSICTTVSIVAFLIGEIASKVFGV
ncbi:MAG: VIT1/CCC1 transporter family protein [Alphaproteobacteria bacterium]|nr:VIT1/CCC1 transporter family protein [Alphaproteobacteria bacterium]